MKNVIKNIKNNRSKQIWLMVLIISMITIITMFVITFVPGAHKDYTLKIKNGGRTFEEEKIFLPLYFTFQSNLLALIVSFLIVFGLISKETAWVQKLKKILAVSLFVTAVLYWTIIYKPNHTSFSLYSTINSHALTPFIYIFVVIWEFKYEKYENKTTIKNVVPYQLIYIISWIIMGIIVYFSINDGKKGAIYGFMNFNTQPIWLSIVLPLGMVPLFGLLVTGLCMLEKRMRKTNKVKI